MADTGTDGPRLTFVGKLFVLLVVAGSLYGAWWLFVQGRMPAAPGATPQQATAERPGAAVEIGISYGTEKKRWLETAVEAFGHTRRGASIKIDLIPRGSVEGAQEIVRGDDAAHRVHVWTPASSLYKDAFVQDWQVKYGGNPILKEERLALSPMV